MQLDIRTLGLITMLSSLVLAVAVITVWRLVPTERSLRDWARGAISLAVGTLLVALRGIAPDWLSIGVANALNILGVGYTYVAVGGLLGQPVNRRWAWLAATVVFVGCLYYSAVEPNLAARIILTSIAFAIFLALSGWMYWRFPDVDLKATQKLTAVIFFGGAILFVIRLFNAPNAQVAADYSSTTNLAVAAPYLYSILFNVWLAVAVSLGVSARLQRSLAEARDRAEAANVAKSQFLATMSHEIRTPLNGILGMAQLLKMPEIDEPQRQEFLDVVIRSGNSLLTLLNDILDLSKIEAGRMEIHEMEFLPADLLREVHQLMLEIAQQKGLELTSHWEGDVAMRVHGDPLRLRQMLTNLVGNAIKFTEQGAVKVSGTLRADAMSGILTCSVTDTGIGIAEVDRQLLFKTFSQVDSSATRRFEGTGLGLSIVRSLAQQMDGEVGVESEAGRGSRFWFSVRVGLFDQEDSEQSSGG